MRNLQRVKHLKRSYNSAFLRSTEWLFVVTNTSIPFSLHAFAKASGEENCGYPEYGGPASVTSRFAIVISARSIIGLIF